MMQELEVKHIKTRGRGWGLGQRARLVVWLLSVRHFKAAFLTAPDTVPADRLFFTAFYFSLFARLATRPGFSVGFSRFCNPRPRCVE